MLHEQLVYNNGGLANGLELEITQFEKIWGKYKNRT